MGIVHPRHLLSRLTAEEWLDWLAYYSLQPWGETRADQRQEALLGTLAAPLMGAGYQMPALRYPYETDGEPEIDSAATTLAVSDYQERFYALPSKQTEAN